MSRLEKKRSPQSTTSCSVPPSPTPYLPLLFRPPQEPTKHLYTVSTGFYSFVGVSRIGHTREKKKKAAIRSCHIHMQERAHNVPKSEVINLTRGSYCKTRRCYRHRPSFLYKSLSNMQVPSWSLTPFIIISFPYPRSYAVILFFRLPGPCHNNRTTPTRILGRMQLTLHATRRTPHGASCLLQAIVIIHSWLVVETRDVLHILTLPGVCERIYTAMHDIHSLHVMMSTHALRPLPPT